MDSKKWLLSFAGAGLLVALLIVLLNLAVDPFGVFGDRLFGWHSSNATMNPRTAKIAYLKENFDKYDSYLVGSSSTAAYSVEKLNHYLVPHTLFATAACTIWRPPSAISLKGPGKNIVLVLPSCAADATGIRGFDGHPVRTQTAVPFLLYANTGLTQVFLQQDL